MLHKPNLFSSGHHLSFIAISDDIKHLVKIENWPEVDAHFKRLTSKGGSLYNFLKTYHDFETIEFIISIRDAANEWEEDGIWHDDGSRVFAFSLSLTDEPIAGGRLGVRRIGEESYTQIPTPSCGGIIMFLTGIYGFEHKIHQVIKGKRIIIAGWCS